MIEAIVDALLEIIGETIYRAVSFVFGGSSSQGSTGEPLERTCLEPAE